MDKLENHNEALLNFEKAYELEIESGIISPDTTFNI
jgi:hypothetical protein